ncbi:MAG: hypothetical protein ACRDHE_14805, partial [Ktedonobacterales bacterium]
MGVDIMAWVEILKPGSKDWSGIVRIDGLVTHSYSMFYMLFGKRGGTRFPPIAAGRGLPADLSEA